MWQKPCNLSLLVRSCWRQSFRQCVGHATVDGFKRCTRDKRGTPHHNDKMNWVKKTFFEKNARASEPPLEPMSPSTSFHEFEAQPRPLDVRRADIRAARELIHTCAKQTAQIYGIAPHWLSFEVLTISDEKDAFFQVQVLMQEWDEYLFAHAYAFELALMKRLSEVNAMVARAVRAVLWRVKHEAGCPYDDLPGPEAWTHEAVSRRAAQRQGVPMVPVPAPAVPLSESEKRALVRPDSPETVLPNFFATSAMNDLAGPLGSAQQVDTEAEYEAARRNGQPPSTLPHFQITQPNGAGLGDREA
jgi:hypothetical protein